MQTFDEFVAEMDQHPKIDVGALYYTPDNKSSGTHIPVQEFGLWGTDKTHVEETLMGKIRMFLAGASKVWIRVLPAIHQVTTHNEDRFYGYARIAKWEESK